MARAGNRSSWSRQAETVWEEFSDEALVLLVARKDEEALRVLYRRYGGAVLALARRMGLGQTDREDCLQEVYVRVWKGAGSYNPQRSSASSWLISVAHHHLVDWIRKQAVRPQTQNSESEFEFFDLHAQTTDEDGRLDRVRIRQALHDLDTAERQVIEVLYYQGYAHSEAAKRLELPLGTLKQRVRQALKKLRGILLEE